MDKLFANLTATLSLHSQALRTGLDKGQTSAEYIGIIAFIAILIVGVIALAPSIAGAIVGRIMAIISSIG